MLKVPERRLRLVGIGLEQLLGFFKAHDGRQAFRVLGIPKDAQIVNAHIDTAGRELVFTLESEEYPLVRHGNILRRDEVKIEGAPVAAPVDLSGMRQCAQDLRGWAGVLDMILAQSRGEATTTPQPFNDLGQTCVLADPFVGKCSSPATDMARAKAQADCAGRFEKPVRHQDVQLTQEGAGVVAQAMDPRSPVGKPVNHQRVRLHEEATPREYNAMCPHCAGLIRAWACSDGSFATEPIHRDNPTAASPER